MTHACPLEGRLDLVSIVLVDSSSICQAIRLVAVQASALAVGKYENIVLWWPCAMDTALVGVLRKASPREG